jgi:hypothetical protein
VLQFFDPLSPVIIQCDASRYALGAALLQGDFGICSFASRSMSEVEQRYSQIEKEMLAIVFAVRKFDDYVFMHPDVTVHTDHKPLEAICGRSLSQAPSRRLKYMLAKLLDYELKVIHVAGSKLWIADSLSRNISMDTPIIVDQVAQEIEEIYCHTLCITPATESRFRAETRADACATAIRRALQDRNWGRTPQLDVWRKVQDQLRFDDQDGLLYKGDQVVVPLSLRQEALQELHGSHAGIASMIRRARDVFFWIGMESQIRDLVAKCGSCSSFQPSQRREPMSSHPVPYYPWQQVSMDYCELYGQYYLVMICSYSGWIELTPVTRLTTSLLIATCSKLFAAYGIPETVIADSGTQFRSQEFNEFARKWPFIITLSSPHYHQSNGAAERAVQTAKNLLKKCMLERSDVDAALLVYRNTPNATTGLSPAQRFFNRRTRIPMTPSSKYMQAVIPSKLRESLISARREAAKAYDSGKRALEPLQAGTSCMVQNPNSTVWNPAQVIQYAGNRSYIVTTPSGQVRRNRTMLRSTHVQPEPADDGDSGEEQLSSAEEPLEDVVFADKVPVDEIPPNLTIPSSTDLRANAENLVQIRRKSQRTVNRDDQIKRLGIND